VNVWSGGGAERFGNTGWVRLAGLSG
jgi:hypothetical protein